MAFVFDGNNKLISLTPGTVLLSVKDAWSRWVDWFLTGDNSKFLPAFAQVGGNDIDLTSGTSIPIYAFLQNGWKFKPQESSHTLNVSDGILLVDGGGDPFVNTNGNFVVRINYQQPVQAITVNTSGSGGATPAQIWDEAIEGSLTARQLVRIMSSVLNGKVSGAGTGTETFRDINDTKNRVVANVDSNGNRTNITTDPT